jgi:hypothetical protein
VYLFLSWFENGGTMCWNGSLSSDYLAVILPALFTALPVKIFGTYALNSVDHFGC